jgi:uncharacterized membrane protein YgdD (TMEM256/DUF423 family)
MANHHRFPLLAAGLLGLSGVALGAFGAHGLQPLLTEHGTAQSWETAARYQLVHTAALLGLAAWLRAGAGAGASRMLWAARFWCAGVALFSGSLYLYAVGGPHFLEFVTPVGGFSFLIGWLLVIITAWVAKDE